MAWNDAPPTKEELKTTGGSWADAPPTKEELGGSWLDTKVPIIGGTVGGHIQGTLDALPIAGTVAGGGIGGVIGAGTGGVTLPVIGAIPGAAVGAIEGAGAGAALGETLKHAGEKFILGKDPTRAELYGGPAKAAIQGVTGEMGGQALGVPLEYAGNALKGVADTAAFKALGGLKAANKEALIRGNMGEIGRQALDEGIVTPFASKQTMLDRVGSKIGEKSGQLQDAINAVMKGNGLTEEQKAILEQAKFDPKSVAERLKTTLRANTSELPDAIVQPRLDGVDSWLSGAPKDIQQTQNFKTQMQQFIKDPSYWKGNPNASQQDLMAIRKAAKESIENMGDKYADMSGTAGGEIKGINRGMGNNLQMEGILDDSVARHGANQGVSLGDKIAATAGAATGGPLGISAGLANKVVREKGNQMLATGADGLGNLFLSSPRLRDLNQSNPEAFRRLTGRLMEGMGESGAGAISRAASTDQKPRDIAHYDPGMERAAPMEDAKNRFLEGN